LAETPVGLLSAGQRRRAMLARALAQVEGAVDAVLLLDEPDANLDPAQAVFLFRKLRLLAARGMAVVAVVHDLHLATEFAQEAWLMRDGALLAAGAAADILAPDRLAQAYGVPVVRGEGLRVG
jgi:ABC-type hemin transport system ATPase subunit